MTTFEPPRPQDKVVILKRIPVFASCTEKQLHLIADRTRLVEYKKGEILYREGDAADAFYIVSSGRLRLFSGSSGAEHTFAILHNGDSFGEISLLTGESHSATVQAVNDTLVLQLQKDDFDEVINRIPSLVLHLSRLLSKRLRTKTSGKEFTDATIASIYSAVKGVGCTFFAVALAATLKQETGRDTVIVDLGGAESSRPWLSGTAEPNPTGRSLSVGRTVEEQLETALVTHPLGFSVVFAGELLSDPGGEQSIAPLLSALINRFAYVLIDLPAEVNQAVLKALTQSDTIYLLTDPTKEHVARTQALMQQVRSSVGEAEQRVKIVLNKVDGFSDRGSVFSLLQAPTERLTAAEIAQRLGQPIHFTLPRVTDEDGSLTLEALARLLESRASPYAMTVRRIARELGGLLVGLALGSGAALGLAHIGVLKVIEREKIPIDIIAGSSIGALVSGLWASGHSAEDLERMALRFKDPWDIRRLFIFDLGGLPIFSVVSGLAAGIGVGLLAGFWTGLLFFIMVSLVIGLALGPIAGGPIQGTYLLAKLRADFAGKTFEETWLPLKIIAANPMAREEVVFDSGPIAEAVRASVSIPGIFKPVTRLGKICLDGGVVNPIPVSVLKRAGAHRVIAVNVFPTTQELTSHLEEVQRHRAEHEAQLATRSFPVRLLSWLRQELIRSVSPLVFDVIMRSMQAMEYQIAEVNCREADLTLRPTVPGSHWLEFFSPEKFIQRGEEVALQHLPEIKRLARVPEQGVDNTEYRPVG